MSETARATSRWAFRVDALKDQRVRQAAGACHRTLTEFVVDAAVIQADHVLADRTRFALPEAEWDRFVELIDRPAQENAGLARLFATPSVFAD